MKCEYCGSELYESDKFCNGCGRKIEKEISSLDTNLNQNNTIIENKIKNNSSVANNHKKKKRGLFSVLLIILVLVIGFSLGYLFSQYQFDNVKEEKREDDNEVEINPPQVKNTTVYFADATFLIPDTIKYQISGNQLHLMSDTWYVAIQENPYSYSAMSLVKDEYQEKLISEGIDASFLSEDKINDSKYLLYEVKQGDKKLLMGVREYTTSSTLLLVMGTNKKSLPDNKIVKEIDDILLTAEFKTIDRNLENNKIDLAKYFTSISNLEKNEIKP